MSRPRSRGERSAPWLTSRGSSTSRVRSWSSSCRCARASSSWRSMTTRGGSCPPRQGFAGQCPAGHGRGPAVVRAEQEGGVGDGGVAGIDGADWVFGVLVYVITADGGGATPGYRPCERHRDDRRQRQAAHRPDRHGAAPALPGPGDEPVDGRGSLPLGLQLADESLDPLADLLPDRADGVHAPARLANDSPTRAFPHPRVPPDRHRRVVRVPAPAL